VVHSHQLPHPPATASSSSLTARFFLTYPQEPHPPVWLEPIAYHDQALDSCQRLAVGRALSTPHLALIAGRPGTGKSRVLAEIIHQARGRGWRVLLVSAHAAGLEAVLRHTSDPGTWVSLVPLRALRDLSILAQQARTEALQTAQLALREAQALRAALPSIDEIATQATALWVEYRAGEEARASLELSATNLEVQVEAQWAHQPEWVAQHEHFTRLSQALEQRLQKCVEQLRLHEQELEQLHKQQEALTSRQQCRQTGHWVSPSWWAALLAGDAGTALVECQRREQELQAIQATLLAEKEALTAEREALEREQTQEAQAARERLRQQISVEHARQTQLAEQQRQHWHSRWQSLLAQSVPSSPWDTWLREQMRVPPPGPEAHILWREQAEQLQQRVQEQVEQQERWIHLLEQHPFETALRASAGVLVTTPAILPLQEQFDLVLVDDAHRLADGDLLALSERGTRCTLVGDPYAARQANRFTQCWQHWYCDPRGHSTTWKHEGDHLVAVMCPEHRYEPTWLTAEPMFDHPEIELRIAHPPQGEPYLAQVCFPAATTLPEALQFLAAQGETRLSEIDQPNVAWGQHGGSITLQWLPERASDAPAGPCVTLEAGVCEHLVAGQPHGWKTASLVFDAGQGWTGQRVRDWLQERLGWCPSDRATLLDRPYRCPPVMRFVPVPAHGRSQGRTGPLEVDLHEPERLPGPPWLPPEVRVQLPTSGLVNPAEACAIVDLLAELLADPLIVTEGERAFRESGTPPIALLTPFAGQAVLLRELLRRAEFHPRFGEWLEVSTLDEYRQRECWFAVVSLTRSAPQHVVSYGEVGDELALALSRATHRVLLVGDPATLSRRVQRGEPRSLEAEMARLLLSLCPEPLAEIPPRPVRSRESSTV
jgi:hypothetical protein